VEAVMPKPLEREFDYYLKNQGELIKKFSGKFIVIKDEEVIGAYDTELEAIKEASKHNELGTFLVQKCEPGSENYTQTFHSRVACE
jgi:3-methyladenine DNA glycosylase AlkD